MIRHLIAGTIISAAVAAPWVMPLAASAATTEEIKAQIQSLLAQIAALQAQLPAPSSAPAATVPDAKCPKLYRTLARGSRGSDVSELQAYLVSQGLLASDGATGFFGGMTEAALQKWQAQNALVASGDANSTGFGLAGARTRALIAARCGTGGPNPMPVGDHQPKEPTTFSNRDIPNATTSIGTRLPPLPAPGYAPGSSEADNPIISSALKLLADYCVATGKAAQIARACGLSAPADAGPEQCAARSAKLIDIAKIAKTDTRTALSMLDAMVSAKEIPSIADVQAARKQGSTLQTNSCASQLVSEMN